MMTHDWATLGARIREVARQAVLVQREEETRVRRVPGVPYLRLIRPEEEEVQPVERDQGSAA